MSGDLQVNKILGAVLATGLVIMGVRVGSEMLFHREAPEKPGYAIEVADTGGEAGAAAAVETLPDWGTVLATADVAAGEKTFTTKCTSCHNDKEGGPNAIGPNLWGAVGRPVASHAGFSYSDAMKAHVADAPAWSYDALFHFLGAPGKVVKGTKMTFAGVKKPEERINLIAYLHTQGSTGYAVPAPDPTRAPGAAPAAAGATPAPAIGATAAPATVAPAATGTTPPKAEAAAKPTVAPAEAAPAH
ncbi:c-type cytochrome [Asticcacaulis benevestitus]|nr:cytochrome c family protein [Asticcacaulis benevestitus]